MVTFAPSFKTMRENRPREIRNGKMTGATRLLTRTGRVEKPGEKTRGWCTMVSFSVFLPKFGTRRSLMLCERPKVKIVIYYVEIESETKLFFMFHKCGVSHAIRVKWEIGRRQTGKMADLLFTDYFFLCRLGSSFLPNPLFLQFLKPFRKFSFSANSD